VELIRLDPNATCFDLLYNMMHDNLCNKSTW